MRHEPLTEHEGFRLLENRTLSTHYDNEALVEDETHLHGRQGEERDIEEGGVADVRAEVVDMYRSVVQGDQG